MIGVPDLTYGEEVMTWIKLREGQSASAKEIREFCRGKIVILQGSAVRQVRDRIPHDRDGQSPEV